MRWNRTHSDVLHKNFKLILSSIFFAFCMIQSNLNTNKTKPKEAAYNDRKSSVRIISHDIFLKSKSLSISYKTIYIQSQFSSVAELIITTLSLYALLFPAL